LVAALLLFYPLAAAPTGFVATLIVSGLILVRCQLSRSKIVSSAAPAIRLAARSGVN
jgi:hypothetical protein